MKLKNFRVVLTHILLSLLISCGHLYSDTYMVITKTIDNVSISVTVSEKNLIANSLLIINKSDEILNFANTDILLTSQNPSVKFYATYDFSSVVRSRQQQMTQYCEQAVYQDSCINLVNNYYARLLGTELKYGNIPPGMTQSGHIAFTIPFFIDNSTGSKSFNLFNQKNCDAQLEITLNGQQDVKYVFTFPVCFQLLYDFDKMPYAVIKFYF